VHLGKSNDYSIKCCSNVFDTVKKKAFWRKAGRKCTIQSAGRVFRGGVYVNTERSNVYEGGELGSSLGPLR
jgi:hypothetical protein